MYHELERAPRPLVSDAPGYVRYALAEADFRAHVAALGENGMRGVSVGETLGADDGDDVDQRDGATEGDDAREGDDVREAGSRACLTFDDGCESDCLFAAPILKDAGFNATFYVVSDFVGRRGHLSAAQLRELSDAGFEIGSHSRTHRYLDDLDGAGLRAEIVCSKERLEEITGRRVEHFSCPGGRRTRRAAEVARAAGYRTLATSSPGVNARATDPFNLRRVAVMRGTSAKEFLRLCRAEGLLRLRAQEAVLAAAKRVMGNAVYEKMRGAVLG
ncbi:MAG: polysaccharide deacetylase family protein [Acidobacteria bacterium]|nr:polysaccharide deacetylase family protein [Acidobacteriota bacterium]